MDSSGTHWFVSSANADPGLSSVNAGQCAVDDVGEFARQGSVSQPRLPDFVIGGLDTTVFGEPDG